MSRETTRRALLGAVLGTGVGGVMLSPASDFLDSFALLSGDAWRGSQESVPDTVSSPHGDTTVTYDDYHVPHIEADTEAAAYFAVGYTQAADRLFEMNLIKRLMDGRLAAAISEQGIESDIFHAKMDFRGAAEASAEALAGSRTEALTEAYTDGVNAFIHTGPAPFEFGWPATRRGRGHPLTPCWSAHGFLGGSLGDSIPSGGLSSATVSTARPTAGSTKSPLTMAHPPSAREIVGQIEGVGRRGETSDTLRNLNPEFVDWLAKFEPPPL